MSRLRLSSLVLILALSWHRTFAVVAPANRPFQERCANTINIHHTIPRDRIIRMLSVFFMLQCVLALHQFLVLFHLCLIYVQVFTISWSVAASKILQELDLTSDLRIGGVLLQYIIEITSRPRGFSNTDKSEVQSIYRKPRITSRFSSNVPYMRNHHADFFHVTNDDTLRVASFVELVFAAKRIIYSKHGSFRTDTSGF